MGADLESRDKQWDPELLGFLTSGLKIDKMRIGPVPQFTRKSIEPDGVVLNDSHPFQLRIFCNSVIFSGKFSHFSSWLYPFDAIITHRCLLQSPISFNTINTWDNPSLNTTTKINIYLGLCLLQLSRPLQKWKVALQSTSHVGWRLLLFTLMLNSSKMFGCVNELQGQICKSIMDCCR